MISHVAIESIRRRPDVRPYDDEVIASLAESIQLVGLVNPIRVRKVGDEYEVTAGSHRLAACDSLGYRTIECIVVDDDDIHAELAMIDENLCRAELSPSERAKQTARRKAIYLELHPETDHGGNAGGPSGQFVQTDAQSFAAETAKATGRDERSVRRDAERGEKVTNEVVDLIRGTKLDTGVFLDKLKKLPADEQLAAAKRDLAAKEKKRDEPVQRGGVASRYALRDEGRPAPEKTFERFIALVDEIEALPIADVVTGSGRRRAVLGQRASGLAERMSDIMERLDH